MTTAIARKPRAVKGPRTTRVVRDITNQTERDCGYELAVLVEVEAGDRTISGILNGETVITCCATEIAAESYLHELATDRIAADAQERDLAVEAVEYQIEQFVADVAAAQPSLTPELPPYIFYSPAGGGFVFGDCARAYNTWIDADNARAEMMTAA